MNNKVVKSTKIFIERKHGWELVDEPEGYMFNLVYKDDEDGIRFVDVAMMEANEFTEEDRAWKNETRRRFEKDMVKWTFDHADVVEDRTAIYDRAEMIMLGDDRGMLRFHTNALLNED